MKNRNQTTGSTAKASKQATSVRSQRSVNARKQAARKPLKGVGMTFHVRVGEKLRKLLQLAQAACAKPEGTFKFPWGDRVLNGLASRHERKDGLVSETGIAICMGDFSIYLPDAGATDTYRRMRVHANVLLCYGRPLSAVVVHICDFVDALTAELVEGHLCYTDPGLKLPHIDEEVPHVETARFDCMPRMETTPRYFFTPSFSRWLAEQGCRA